MLVLMLILLLLFDRHVGQGLEILYYAGVIVTKMSVNLKGLHYFVELCCIWHRNINGMSRLNYICNVLVIYLDGAARNEIVIDHHRCFGIK